MEDLDGLGLEIDVMRADATASEMLSPARYSTVMSARLRRPCQG